LILDPFLFFLPVPLFSFSYFPHLYLFLLLLVKSFSFLIISPCAKGKCHPTQFCLFSESKAMGVGRLEAFGARCERSEVCEQLCTKHAYLLLDFVLVDAESRA
jgi:hypothetical protein